jgi:MoaA/NifB/PqqE/SkfB family radical SAM enzyme
MTNGTLVNDKKARFLRQIEQNHDYEIIFRLSIDHYTEEKNDEIRGKDSFKKALSGIENLLRYGFNPILSVVNIWGENPDDLRKGFSELLSKVNFEPDDINFKIIPPLKLGEYAKNFGGYDENELVTNEKLEKIDKSKFDCASSRIVTNNGVFVCPILINDPRGKVGNTLTDSSKQFFLEQNACYTCQLNKKGVLNNNWQELGA